MVAGAGALHPMITTDIENRAEEQARIQFEGIADMVARLTRAQEQCAAGGGDDEDAARLAILEGPLTGRVRSGWHTPGEPDTPEEYEILLCTGGPAVRIVGGLDAHGEPETARLEYQDWFTPWEEYPLTSEEESVLVEYARCFSYGA